MILSYKHKYIFFHVPKTGGSSLAVYLSQFLGDDDIMVDAWNDALRRGVAYNLFFLRKLNGPYALEYIKEAINRRIEDRKVLERPILDFAFRKIMKPHFGTESVHMAWECVNQYDPVAFRDFKKFTVVRNPFAHAVSLFRWREKDWSLDIRHGMTKDSNSQITNETFKTYLRKLYTRMVEEADFYPSGLDIFYDPSDEELKVDFVLRLEDINSEIISLSRTLGLGPSEMKFPHAKYNGGVDMKRLYCSECEWLVRQIWETELNLFDYSRPF